MVRPGGLCRRGRRPRGAGSRRGWPVSIRNRPASEITNSGTNESGAPAKLDVAVAQPADAARPQTHSHAPRTAGRHRGDDSRRRPACRSCPPARRPAANDPVRKCAHAPWNSTRQSSTPTALMELPRRAPLGHARPGDVRACGDGGCPRGGSSPTSPSTDSRMRSAWPTCRVLLDEVDQDTSQAG